MLDKHASQRIGSPDGYGRWQIDVHLHDWDAHTSQQPFPLDWEVSVKEQTFGCSTSSGVFGNSSKSRAGEVRHLDVAQDLFVLALIDHRPQSGVMIKRVANHNLLGSLLQASVEFFGCCVLH